MYDINAPIVSKHSSRPWRVLGVVFLLSCGSQSLRSVGGALVVPEAVEFEPTYAGFASEVTIELENQSRAARSLELSIDAPFEVAQPRMALTAGGSSSVVLRFRPLVEGSHAGALVIHVEGETLTVPLQGAALAVPSCESSECLERHFEPGRGCVEAPKPEGTSCGAGDRCLENASCHAGTCVGSTVSCDDGNACTSDACAADRGCVHETIQCEAVVDPCLASACDPVLGCRAVPVVDGTSCGANDCQTAHVCISGACVVRTSPEGSICAPATTCHAESRCVNGACAVPASNQPPLAWSYAPRAGHFVTAHAIASDGAIFFLERDGRSPASVTLEVFEKTGTPRFEVELTVDEPSLEYGERVMIDEATNRVFVAARSLSNTSGTKAVIEAFEAHTGARLWKHDVSADVALTDGAQKKIEFQQLLLLDGGQVGVHAVEGNSIHQLHLLALDGATGTLGFRIQRGGHGRAGVSKSGLLFLNHTPCWSPQSYLTSFDVSGREVSTVTEGAWVSAFATDSVVLWNGRQFELAGASLSNRTPVPLPPNHLFTGGSFAWSPTETTYVSRGAQGLFVNRPVGSTVQWSTLVSNDFAKWVSVQRLDAGRTAAFVTVSGALTQDLVVLSSAGQVVDRCELPAGSAEIVGGVTVMFGTSGFRVFSTPTLDAATTGWLGSAGGLQGTNRSR